ncbi:hypothetical protein [Flavobacterium sp.]|jgi:LysM repeat protein|uniref:hypothetical protein n=1 Tax=Flavobacterium sp. TaxID=239 RepID=UPI0037BFB737
MRKIVFLYFLVSQFALSQSKSAPVIYKYGQNGIELIAKNNNETIVISTFQAKVTIKEEIAAKLFSYYQQNKDKESGVITIEGDKAKITGTYTVKKKGTLTSVDFRYDKVEWQDGLVEVSE